MQQEKRRSRRRKIGYPAQIATPGNEPVGCVLLDVSETGARVEIDPSIEVPDHFTLLLSRNGAARRQVEVVWREDTDLGLRFVRPSARGKERRGSSLPAMTDQTPPTAPEQPDESRPDTATAPAQSTEAVKID